MYRVIVIALTAVLAVGAESKGEIAMQGNEEVAKETASAGALKLSGPQRVSSEDGELKITFAVLWDEDGKDIKVALTLGDQPPKQPPKSPYNLRPGHVEAKKVRLLGAIWDASKFAPGARYNVTAKIEYRTNSGAVRTESLVFSLAVPGLQTGTPSAQALDKGARANGRQQQRPRKNQSMTGEDIPAPPIPPKLKVDVNPRIKAAKDGSGTEYNFQLTNNDTLPITSFQLSNLASSSRVTGIPNGWRELPGSGGGAAWVISDPKFAIQPGKHLDGFIVVGPDTRTNVTYGVVASGKGAAYGEVLGPGK